MDMERLAAFPSRPALLAVESLRQRGPQLVDEGPVRARLTLDPRVPVVGGEVGGIIDIDLPHDAANRFRVTLYATYSYPGDTSDGAGWLETGRGLAVPGPAGEDGVALSCIKFRFVLPLHVLPSGERLPALSGALGVPPNLVSWTVLVEQRGAGLAWSFDIFVSGATTLAHAEAVCDVPETGKTGATPIDPAIFYRKPHANWLALVEPPEDADSTTAIWLLISAGCIGGGWWAGGAGWFAVLLGVFFLGAIIYGLGMRNVITVMQDALVVRRWWFGIDLQKRTVPAERITALRVNPHPALPPGHSTWSIEALVEGEGGVWLVNGVKDSRQAYVLRRWIDQVLRQGIGGPALEGELPLAEFLPERGPLPGSSA
jgi:hypothetical protein